MWLRAAVGHSGAMIEVKGLTKSYGSFVAVDDISFVAEPGRVTGFLGPNGAGKSTTMRVIVGLTPASRGTTTIAGHRYAQIPNPGRHVGVLLDASAQHAGRTGREVLVVSAETMGLPRTRVDEMVEVVGLTPSEAKRRVKNYSLGMRQRLGIAQALLGDPSVLVLDEPANGLDPAGIHWMRGLLREYAARGGTVLLSSHLLNEVELIADDMVVIGNGRIVAQGSKAEMLHAAGTFAKALDQASLVDALRRSGIESKPSRDGLHTDVEPVQVGKVAAEAGIVLAELRPADGAGLEELFLQLTSDSQRDPQDDVQPEGATS
jgi:ABC-2 type transport system ATP-binding protein